MAFPEEQYKFIHFVAPNLSSFAEFMELLGRDQEKGEIELLLRRIGRQQKFQFEGVIAHARAFRPEWEKVVFKTKILAYNPVLSAKYDFKSKPFWGLDSFRILGDYCAHTNACCDDLDLERDVNVQKERPSDLQDPQELYCLQGWIQGPIRNALTGHDYLRDTLGKGIGVAGTLSYR